MSRFVIYTVYLLCSGLNNEDERPSAPPYRDPVLHFHAPRPIALRGGDRNEEARRNREGERSDYAPRLRTYTGPTQPSLLLEHSFQPNTKPALRTGLMAPVWRLLHVSRKAIPDLS